MRTINNKEKLLETCRNNDIVFLEIFGSFVKGDFTKKSDIDLLARFSKPKSLLELVRIERISRHYHTIRLLKNMPTEISIWRNVNKYQTRQCLSGGFCQ